jgi:hypothetical protein
MAVATASALLVSIAVAVPAAAAGTTFELSVVVQQVKQDLLQVERDAATASPSPFVRIDEAQLELNLVEVAPAAGRRSTVFAVPGADFVSDAKDGARPPLKRRLMIDLVPGKDGPPTAAPGIAAAAPTAIPPMVPTVAAANGALTAALSEIVAGVRQAEAGAQAFAAKRLVVDIDFAVDRPARGGIALVVAAGGRKIAAPAVHGLKLKLAVAR